MKNKKLVFAVIALVAVLALMLGVWSASRQKPADDPVDENPTDSQVQQDNVADVDSTGESTGEEFEINFTVEIVHSDGSVKTFTYGIHEEEYLGAFLTGEGLIIEGASPGMYNTVDGETADWSVNQSYWAFYVNGEYAIAGMNDTLIQDGDVYKLEYTLG